MGAVLQDASNRSVNAREPSVLWNQQEVCAKLAAGGNVVTGAIMVQAKDKGKSTAKGDSEAQRANPKSVGRPMQTLGCGDGGKGKRQQNKGKRKGLYYAGPNMRMTRRKTPRTTKRKRSLSRGVKVQLTMRGGLVR